MPDPDVRVIPKEPWNSADKADATEIKPGGKTYIDVDVRQFYFTPDHVLVRKQNFPKGVVILNELAFPNHQNAIETQNNPNFKVIWVPRGQDYASVPIVEDVGWPHGYIVLFKD